MIIKRERIKGIEYNDDLNELCCITFVSFYLYLNSKSRCYLKISLVYNFRETFLPKLSPSTSNCSMLHHSYYRFNLKNLVDQNRKVTLQKLTSL